MQASYAYLDVDSHKALRSARVITDAELNDLEDSSLRKPHVVVTINSASVDGTFYQNIYYARAFRDARKLADQLTILFEEFAERIINIRPATSEEIDAFALAGKELSAEKTIIVI